MARVVKSLSSRTHIKHGNIAQQMVRLDRVQQRKRQKVEAAIVFEGGL